MRFSTAIILAGGAAFWISAIVPLLLILLRTGTARGVRKNLGGFVVTLLAVLASSLILFRPEHNLQRALGIEDAAEYALAAESVLDTGSYRISVAGNRLPPRFGPGFSVFVLAPVMHLASKVGIDPLSATTLAISALGVLLALAAATAGFSLAGPVAAIVVPGLIFVLPEIRYYVRLVMSDVPFTAIVLLSFLLSLFMIQERRHLLFCFFTAGVLVAFGFLVRPLGVVLLLPFLWLVCSGRFRNVLPHKVYPALALCAPVLCAIGFSAAYNMSTFESPSRTGYHYWMSVPYDFPSLVFSPVYVSENFRELVLETALAPLLLLCVALCILVRKKGALPDAVSGSLLFASLVGLPLFVVHLLYFYPSSRFVLPLSTLACVIVGSMAATLIAPSPRAPGIVLASLVLLGASALLRLAPVDESISSLDISSLRAVSNDESVFLTERNPVLLERFLGEEGTVLPWSRQAPYASKVVMEHAPRIAGTLPPSWDSHRWPPLFEMGAQEVYPYVGAERVQELLAANRTVLLDPLLVEPLRELPGLRYELVREDGGIFRVVPHQDRMGHSE